MARKNFAVIGLGAFGRSVAENLINKKLQVTVFDTKKDKVDAFSQDHEPFLAVTADCTNNQFIEEHSISSFDCIILAIASNIEASVIMASKLYESDLASRVIARAKNETQKGILKKIGINNIVLADQEIGEVVASRAIFGVDFQVKIINNDFGAAEVEVLDENKTAPLSTFNLLNQKEIIVLFIKRKNTLFRPSEVQELKLNDRILIVARINKIETVINFLRKKISFFNKRLDFFYKKVYNF